MAPELKEVADQASPAGEDCIHHEWCKKAKRHFKEDCDAGIMTSGYYILAERLNKLEPVSRGGIIMPEQIGGVVSRYQIVSVGAKVADVTGVQLKKGDIVWMHTEDGFPVPGSTLKLIFVGPNNLYAVERKEGLL